MNWALVARIGAYLAEKRNEAKHSDGRHGLTMQHVLVVGVIIAAPVVIVVMVVLLGVATVLTGTPAAAAGGALGIPPVVFSAYVAAESNAPGIAEDCVVDWPIIAGIWKVESNHATYRGRTVTPDGIVTPPLYGITLDGSTPSTARIPDTDGGVLDGNPTWDRAVGPAQFLPGSWRALGQDGNSDGIKDPQNVFDAALATVAHLCVTAPGDYTNPDDLAAAILRYNNSTEYVTTVTGWIGYYRSFRFTEGAVTADGVYAFPLPASAVTLAQIRRTHHDYPASDLLVPEGTPIYAAHPGTVTRISTPCADTQRCRCGWGVHVAGADGHTYSYCHGSQAFVQAGTDVTAGELIMASGNTGNSDAPHLHFQIRNPDGALLCPQPLLEAWWTGISLSPIAAPTSGCTR